MIIGNSKDLHDTATASGSPDSRSRPPVLGARPVSHDATRLNARALGPAPPGLPKAVERIQKESDTSQSREEDTVLQNVYPLIEEEGGCFTIKVFHEDGDVPLEPRVRGALPERCTDGVEQLPQQCLGARGDIRELARETPMTPVALTPVASNTMSGSPSDAQGGQRRLNEAESLQRIVGMQRPNPDGFPSASREKVYVGHRTNTDENVLAGKEGDPGILKSKQDPRITTPETTTWQKEETTDLDRAFQNRLNADASKKQGGNALYVVNYREGEQPMSEILRLEGGQGMPVIVESVAAGSKVSIAGVEPGYSLVSLNGRNEFLQLPGWQVRLLLEAPITLAFDPTPQPGRARVNLCTEIRLKKAKETIGVHPKVAVCSPKERTMLAEEVVFKQGSAPLFIKGDKATPALNESHRQIQDPPSSQKSALKVKEETNSPYIYELRQRDAQVILGRAVHGARSVVEPTLEVECVGTAHAVQGSSWRALSPFPACSIDLMAKWVDSREDSYTNLDANLPAQRHFMQKVISQSANRVGPVSTNSHMLLTSSSTTSGTKANIQSDQTASEATSPFGGIAKVADLQPFEGDQFAPAASSRGGECGCAEEGGDDWLNFQNSRSPLRWLAPVLEPVVRAFSPSRSPSQKMPAGSSNSPRRSPCSSPRGPRHQNLFAGITPQKTIDRNESLEFEQARRGRNDTITPIFTQTTPSFTKETGNSSPEGRPRKRSSHIQPLGEPLGRPVRNIQNLSGPRSRSPQNRPPAGDSPVEDYHGDIQERKQQPKAAMPNAPIFPSGSANIQAPSFSMSFQDVLDEM